MKRISFPFAMVGGLLLACVLCLPAQAQNELPPLPAPGVGLPDDTPKTNKLGPLLTDLLKTYDKVLAARAKVSASEHTVEAAWGQWYPQVDVSAEGGWEERQRALGQGTTAQGRNQQDLNFSQLLWDFGKANGLIARAGHMLKESEAALSQAEQEAMNQGVTAYLQCIRFWETLRYAIKSEENIKELSGMEEALVRKGASLSYKELQIKAQLSGAQSYRVTVERALDNARHRFRAMFTQTVERPEIASFAQPAVPEPLPGTVDEAVNVALDVNPTLIQAEETVRRAQAEVEVQKANFYPTLKIKGTGYRKEQDQGQAGVETSNKVSAEIRQNIFNGFTDLETVRALNQSVIEARKLSLDRRRTVEENVRNAWADLITYRKNAELYRVQSDITWEFLNLIKKKRMMGETVELLDILIGERDYIQASSAAVTADIDMNTAAYTLLYQMGKLNLGLFTQ